jgi:hypothetical protein
MSSLLLAAQKTTEESLIKAWEELQKRDSNTSTFEKIADTNLGLIFFLSFMHICLP